MTSHKNQIRCDGCTGNVYSAPGGQALKRWPHSRCSWLDRDIPMILGDHGRWIASDVPLDCPRHPSASKEAARLT